MTLRLRDVHRAFGGVRAVDGASFDVAPSEVHGLIGPNGAGKTSVLNLVSGFLAPQAGQILLEGRSLGGLPPHRVAALGVSRTFQNIRLFPDLSARDNVVVGLHLRRHASLWARMLLLPSARIEEEAARETAERLLSRVGLSAQTRVHARHLSYGEQRRVEIARALACGPRLLLLDEPTAGMSLPEVKAVAALIRQVASEGRAVLLVEHNVRLVMEVCDRITVLAFGKVIASGKPAEVARDRAVVAAYLGDAA